MNRLTRTTYLALLLAVLLGSGSAALAASEVKGTLSSDGSSPSSAPMQTQSDTLQGSVVGGTDDPEMAILSASAENSATNSVMWSLIPLSLLGVVAIAYYLLYMRRHKSTLP